MKPDMHIVWLMPSGSLTVTSLGDSPQAGVYQHGDEVTIVQPAAQTESDTIHIASLDALVARGAATFMATETDDQYIDRIAAATLDAGAVGQDAKRMPNVSGKHYQSMDHEFFNAFTCADGSIDVDMAKAREIHKDTLRDLRTPKLAALDVDYMRALESGDTSTQADIVKCKQALREITEHPGIAAATNTEQLKAVIPDALY